MTAPVAAADPLPEAMARLRSERASGELMVTLAAGSRTLFFDSGEVRAVLSSCPGERLGSWLVAEGLADEEEVALALLAQQGTEAGSHLGEILAVRGVLDANALDGALARQASAIVGRAAATGGRVVFTSREDGPHPDTLAGITTAQLLLVAAREWPDEGRKRRALGEGPLLVAAVKGYDELLVELSLTPTEAFLLSRLSAAMRLDLLAATAGLPEADVGAVVYALRLAGLVEVMPGASRPEDGRRSGPVEVGELETAHGNERERIDELARNAVQVDHYAALGLEPGATHDEVVSAWRQLRSELDPKRSADEPHLRDLGWELRTARERAWSAYEVLSSPVRRQRYDAILARSRVDEAEDEGAVEREERARSELVEANRSRAEEVAAAGDEFTAIQLLEQACALDPQPLPLVELARMLARNPLWGQRALTALRRAVDLDPACTEAWVALAELWHERGDEERERKALEQALRIDDQHPRAAEMYRALAGDEALRRVREWLASRR